MDSQDRKYINNYITDQTDNQLQPKSVLLLSFECPLDAAPTNSDCIDGLITLRIQSQYIWSHDNWTTSPAVIKLMSSNCFLKKRLSILTNNTLTTPDVIHVVLQSKVQPWTETVALQSPQRKWWWADWGGFSMSGYIIITYQDSVTAAGTVCTSTSAGLQRRLLSVLPLLLRFYSHLVFFTITSSTLLSPHLL